MTFQSLVIAGGAGFVGSNLAVSFRRRSPDRKVTVIDSLKRQGPPRIRPDDRLLRERSVQAGRHGSPHQVLDINLTGTIHCLETARVERAAFLFLSTSRICPIGPLRICQARYSCYRLDRYGMGLAWTAARPSPNSRRLKARRGACARSKGPRLRGRSDRRCGPNPPPPRPWPRVGREARGGMALPIHGGSGRRSRGASTPMVLQSRALMFPIILHSRACRMAPLLFRSPIWRSRRSSRPSGS